MKQQLSAEQKKLDLDLWIIVLVTLGVYLLYAALGNRLMDFVADDRVSVVPRLLLNAAVQFGVAGLGVTIVCVWRKEPFTAYGLTRKHMAAAILATLLCFVPLVCVIVLSGQFDGYHPFRISITEDVLASGIPFSLLGMALIVVVWGFFEGFNYAVICDKVNRRYPSKNPWLDYGAIVCAIVCVLFHPCRLSFWGIAEMLTMALAIYGMLLVKGKTGNAWGCIFAFCLIWNAI